MKAKGYVLPGLVIALLCLASWGVRAQRQNAHKVTWEYRTIEVMSSNAEAKKQLNALGAQGWELVGIVPNLNEGRTNGGGVYYLKRER